MKSKKKKFMENDVKTDIPEDEQEAYEEDSEKTNNKLTEKVNSINAWAQRRREENDIVFREPLTPAPAVDETQPLRKGSVDMWFLFWAMILMCLGAIMSYSASAVYAEQVENVNATHYLWEYITFTVIAGVITVPFVIFARPWHWRIFGAGSYVAAIFLLVLVLFIGIRDPQSSAAQRWISIGGFFTIQPSEIAKLALVMMLALYMSKYEKQITSYGKFTGCFKHGFFAPMTIIGILGILIALEGHISGLMIIAILGVTMMFVGGSRPKYLLIMFAIIAVAFLLLVAVSSYAQSRIEMWWHPENDPQGKGWQTLQGLYAIGSGGFFGLGLGFSRQKFGYVSQPQNDFIFTIICEELGFMGALLVILLFALLIWRGIKIGQHAPDKFSALVVFGLTFKIAIQVLLNIAVVTNTIPNTGITLPFFSAGGTSQIIQLFELGIILSISRFSTQKK